MSDGYEVKERRPFEDTRRTLHFWRRASGVYFAYKAAQARAAFLSKAKGWDADRLKEEFWKPHHTWAGKEFHSMAVDLRGFYLKGRFSKHWSDLTTKLMRSGSKPRLSPPYGKLGQFFAARAEFVPEPICRKLSLLHDRVPPMPASQARAVIEEELGGLPLEEVFDWIDLDEPLGSASIAQVHKGRLRVVPREDLPLDIRIAAKRQRRTFNSWQLGLGPEILYTPSSRSSHPSTLPPGSSSAGDTETMEPTPLQLAQQQAARQAVLRASASVSGPKDGVVAVKVQYPDALPTMLTDLRSIRKWAGYLQKTEIKFDMLSAVDELAKQVVLEFDFRREAGVMDRVADNLKSLARTVEIPRSMPDLTTERLLVMSFVEGDQITRLEHRTKDLSARKKNAAKKLIMDRVSRTFGVMMLDKGLFQADAHPGNILVMKGARIGLIDYGQSKQLPEQERLAFASLLVELGKGNRGADPSVVAQRLQDLGLRFERYDNVRLMSKMAFGMFDTRKSHKVDPFSDDSPIKALGIAHFPPDVFFVLRVMQLLRGLAGGLGVEFSAAEQWTPYAKRALRRAGRSC